MHTHTYTYLEATIQQGKRVTLCVQNIRKEQLKLGVARIHDRVSAVNSEKSVP